MYCSEWQLGELGLAENHPRPDRSSAVAEEMSNHSLPELIRYGQETCRECPGQCTNKICYAFCPRKVEYVFWFVLLFFVLNSLSLVESLQ